MQTDAEINREPLLSNMKELEVHQRPAYADHPIDYPVPDFGVSHEIRYTQNNIKNAEKALNHKLSADWEDKKGPLVTDKVSYFLGGNPFWESHNFVI